MAKKDDKRKDDSNIEEVDLSSLGIENTDDKIDLDFSPEKAKDLDFEEDDFEEDEFEDFP
jgi:hypothetical protein